MMKNRVKLIPLLMALAMFCFANASFAKGFSKLVVFGDSLSDTGNLAAATVDFPFPFFENRISNGPVLADYVGGQIGSKANASEHLVGRAVGFNYAVAGGNIVGSDPEDLSSQIDAYLSRLQGKADSGALYFVFIGGNDLRDIRSVSSLVLATERISKVLDILTAQIKRLADAGATTFLLPNMPNIGRLPGTLQRESSDPGVVERGRAYSLLYNQMLAAKLVELRRELRVGITEFDLFAQFEVLFANPQQFGFTQTEIGCFDLDGFTFQAECVFGTRFDRFVFFDSLHPSSKTNELIGLKLAEVIPEGIFESVQKVIITPILQLLFD